MKTPAAVDAEERTLKAQMRRQQKHLKQPRTVHAPDSLASLPVASVLPGKPCFTKEMHRNAECNYMYVVASLLMMP